jgi:hypothetical protein
MKQIHSYIIFKKINEIKQLNEINFIEKLKLLII